MDGFDLKLATAFANQIRWHSANTNTFLLWWGEQEKNVGESVVGHEMSLCSSKPGS